MASVAASYDVRDFAGGTQYDHLVDVGSPDVWWQQDGPLGGLHLVNELRVPYFERALGGYAGKRILDVGCGGGVFAEAIAGAGARVVGIDPSARSIAAAHEHARALDIDYRVTSAEAFDTTERFDAVMAVDVLEHVDDLAAALDACVQVLEPGSVFGFLTHNQTPKAFATLIWKGEYLHQRIPKGTHDFHKFIDPDDLTELLEQRDMDVAEIRGVDFNHLLRCSGFVDSLDVTYIGYAIKR